MISYLIFVDLDAKKLDELVYASTELRWIELLGLEGDHSSEQLCQRLFKGRLVAFFLTQ